MRCRRRCAAAHADGCGGAGAAGRGGAAAGRCGAGQGQPGQPHEAGGAGDRRARGGGSGLMLYNLLAPLADQFILFNLFRYLTFRSGAACMTALVLSLALGPALHPLAEIGAAQRPADPPGRAGAAPGGEEGHADHGRRADPGVADSVHPAVGQSAQRLCVGGAAADPGLRRDRLRRRLHQAVEGAISAACPARGKLVAAGGDGPGGRHRLHAADPRAAGHRLRRAGVQGSADPARLRLPAGRR